MRYKWQRILPITVSSSISFSVCSSPKLGKIYYCSNHSSLQPCFRDFLTLLDRLIENFPPNKSNKSSRITDSERERVRYDMENAYNFSTIWHGKHTTLIQCHYNACPYLIRLMSWRSYSSSLFAFPHLNWHGKGEVSILLVTPCP